MPENLKNAAKGNKPFWICLGVAIFLLLGSAIVPPPFVIDASIFAACGILFAFASLYVLDKAIDKGTGAKITKGDVSLEIEKKDE